MFLIMSIFITIVGIIIYIKFMAEDIGSWFVAVGAVMLGVVIIVNVAGFCNRNEIIDKNAIDVLSTHYHSNGLKTASIKNL